jgi:hypothetical protein
MKAILFLSALMFATFCEGIPTTSAKLLVGKTTPPPVVKPVPVSSKKVEVFIDEIGKSLTLEHENALRLVRSQQRVSLLKKQKLDVISEKLSNITGTYTLLTKERQKSLTDYQSYMADFKQVQDLIDKNKLDYESEMKFLEEIKGYIKKVKNSKCIF